MPVRENRQRYRGDTMILETNLICEGGAVRITDFMPVGGGRCDLVRLVGGLEGEVSMEMLLCVRFGFGKDLPWITLEESGSRFVAGPECVVFRSPAELRLADGRVSAYLQVKKGNAFRCSSPGTPLTSRHLRGWTSTKRWARPNDSVKGA